MYLTIEPVSRETVGFQLVGPEGIYGRTVRNLEMLAEEDFQQWNVRKGHINELFDSYF